MKARLQALRTLRRDLAPFVGPGFTRGMAIMAFIGVVIGLLEALALRVIGELAAELGDARESDQLFSLSFGTGTLLAVGFGAAVLVIGARWIEARLTSRISLDTMAAVRSRLSRAWLQTHHLEQQRHPAGRAQEWFTTHTAAVGAAVMGLIAAATSICVLLVLTIAAIAVEPWAVLFLLGAVVVLAVLVTPLQGRIRRIARLNAANQLEYGTAVNDMVVASEVTRYFSTFRAAEARHGAASARDIEIQTRGYTLRRFAGGFYRSLTMLLLLAGLGVLVAARAGNLATASAVVLLLVRALLESQTVYTSLVWVTERLPFLRELVTVIDDLEAQTPPVGTEPMDPVTSVEIDDLEFSYPDGPPVADGYSLRLTPGASLGIGGPSGGGKSTLLRMLMGALEPTGGSIAINGVAPTGYDPEQRARHMAFVPQDPLLLTATVRDNVRFDREWIDAAAVESALQQVGFHDEVNSWPEGYDTVIGHRAGRELSGGQAQRISVARALAGGPSLLLMDEPTSALDTQSEAGVVASVVGGDDLIVVVVSHRHDVLASCDEIVELVDGRLNVVEGR